VVGRHGTTDVIADVRRRPVRDAEPGDVTTARSLGPSTSPSTAPSAVVDVPIPSTVDIGRASEMMGALLPAVRRPRRRQPDPGYRDHLGGPVRTCADQ